MHTIAVTKSCMPRFHYYYIYSFYSQVFLLFSFVCFTKFILFLYLPRVGEKSFSIHFLYFLCTVLSFGMPTFPNFFSLVIQICQNSAVCMYTRIHTSRYASSCSCCTLHIDYSYQLHTNVFQSLF